MSLFLSQEWIKAARLDIANIVYIIEDEDLSSVVAFHSQQAIEKSLKALLTAKNINFRKIHSIEKLLNLAQGYLSIENYDLVDLLDSLYIESRYPGDMELLPYGKPTLEDAREFYDFTNKLFTRVCTLLKIDIHKPLPL